MPHARRIVFTGKDQVELAEEEIPDPGPGEVLIKATRTLISTGTEGICLGRLFDPGTHWDKWVQYPFHAGYSFAGRVAAVGSDVQGVSVGDRVGTRSGHQEWTVLRPAGLFPIPEGVTDEEATWLALGATVQTSIRHVAPQLGEAVVIVGLGLLGQLVTQYMRLMGARQIIAVDRWPERVDVALAHGATHGVPLPVQDARDEVMRLTGMGAEIVYDVTGNPEVLEHALPLVRTLGRLGLLGDTGTPSRQRLTSDVVPRGLRIVGAHDSSAPPVATLQAPWTHQALVQLFYSYLARGEMRVSDLVTHRFRPEQAKEAYHLLQTGRRKAMGVIFDWDS